MLHACAPLHVAKVGTVAELGLPVILFCSAKSEWRVNTSGENSPTHRLCRKGHFWKVGDEKDTESRWLSVWRDALPTRKCTKKKAAGLPLTFPEVTLSIGWWGTPGRLKHTFTGGRSRRAYSENGFWILNFCRAGWRSFYSPAKAKLTEYNEWYYCRAENQQSWAGASSPGDSRLHYSVMPHFGLFGHFMVPPLGQHSLLQRVNLLMLKATEDSVLHHY